MKSRSGSSRSLYSAAYRNTRDHLLPRPVIGLVMISRAKDHRGKQYRLPDRVVPSQVQRPMSTFDCLAREVAARVVLPPSGTTLLFVAPRNAVAARLTCRKRFRPIYSCSRIRMDYSRLHSDPASRALTACTHLGGRALGLRARTLEPLWNLSPHCERLKNRAARISCWNFNGLIGGRTRTRTLDPLIKSYLPQGLRTSTSKGGGTKFHLFCFYF